MAEPARKQWRERVERAAELVEKWPDIRREHKDAWHRLVEMCGGATKKFEEPFGQVLARFAALWRCHPTSVWRRLKGLHEAKLLAIRKGPNLVKLRVVIPRRLPPRPGRKRLGLVGQRDPQRRLFDEGGGAVKLSVFGGASATACGCAQPQPHADADSGSLHGAAAPRSLHGEAGANARDDMTCTEKQRLLKSLCFSGVDWTDRGQIVQFCLDTIADPKMERWVAEKAAGLVVSGAVPRERLLDLLQKLVNIRQEGQAGLGPGFKRGAPAFFHWSVKQWAEWQSATKGKAAETRDKPATQDKPSETAQSETNRLLHELDQQRAEAEANPLTKGDVDAARAYHRPRAREGDRAVRDDGSSDARD